MDLAKGDYVKCQDLTPQPSYGMDRANLIAASICSTFSFRSMVILSINNSFRIVTMVSKFATHLFGKPSSGPRATSTGMPLIRVVTSATDIALLIVYASSRERRMTGRRPRGGGNFAHQTSPFRITIPLERKRSLKPFPKPLHPQGFLELFYNRLHKSL